MAQVPVQGENGEISEDDLEQVSGGLLFTKLWSAEVWAVLKAAQMAYYAEKKRKSLIDSKKK
jgi:hypothetical protein